MISRNKKKEKINRNIFQKLYEKTKRSRHLVIQSELFFVCFKMQSHPDNMSNSNTLTNQIQTPNSTQFTTINTIICPNVFQYIRGSHIIQSNGS